MMVFFYQPDVQILYFNTFITFHRLRESSRSLCTERSPKESDDTRGCVNIIVLLKMSTIMLETCRGINKCIKIKNLCIKLTKKKTIIILGCRDNKT